MFWWWPNRALRRLETPEKRDTPKFHATDWRFVSLTLAWCMHGRSNAAQGINALIVPSINIIQIYISSKKNRPAILNDD